MKVVREWTTSSGFKAMICKHPVTDSFNGYVEIPKGHTLYDTNYLYDLGDRNYAVDYLDVHGGITFADFIGSKFYYGFDTIHFGDTPEVCDMLYVSA